MKLFLQILLFFFTWFLSSATNVLPKVALTNYALSFPKTVNQKLESEVKNGVCNFARSGISENSFPQKDVLWESYVLENRAREANDRLVKGAGKVWDDIVATQLLYDANSLIYKSFELKAGNTKVWVHGNATEHLRELELNILKDISKTPDAKRLSIELILTDFQGAVKEVTKNGVKHDELIPIGKWEFKFSAPRESGQLPALIHAQPK